MLVRIKDFWNKQKVFRRYGRFDEETLLIATEDGNESCLGILLKAGKKIDYKGRKGQTALHRALVHDQTSCFKFLVRQGANIDAQDKIGQTPLMYAVEYKNKEAFTYLLERGANLDIMDQMEETILFKTIKAGETTLSRKLIDAGADVNHQNIKGETPLMVSVDTERIGIIKSLLHHGADPVLTDEDGKTVLHRNVPSLRIKKILQKASVQHRIEEHDKHLNLIENFGTGDFDILPIADGLLTQFPRLSALLIGLADGFYANLNEQYDLQSLEKKGRELIDHLEKLAEESIQQRNPANRQAKTQEPESKSNSQKQEELDQALVEAVQNETYHLVEFLLKMGASPKAKQEDGKNTLFLAGKNSKLAKVLLSYGVDPFEEDKEGHSPYLQARKNNWKDILEIFKNHEKP